MEKPKIRFKGYQEDWEQRKLGELCSLITKGTTPKDKSGNGEVNFVKVENIDTDNGEITSMSKISVEEHEGYLRRSRLEENDILFSIAGTLGRVSVVKPSILPANTNQALAIIRTNKGYIPYLTTVLKGPAVEDFIRKNPTIGAQPNLSLEQVNNLDISYPEYDEQVKIGDYFESLDNLITLHQRKCEETKILKKYMLQKMFPQNGHLVPEIRFSGFTEDWEQRKLGENIVEYTEKTTENNQYPVLTSSRKGIFFQTDYYDGNQIASADNTGYNIVPYGYFTYRHMSDDEIFHFNINDIAENGIVSTLYPVFTTDENLDSRYLQYQLNYGREFAKYAILQKQGGSRTYMYLNKLKNLYITVPTTIEEQKKISEFFTNLDHLITLHQRKCEELQNIKKYMLQNMFV